MFIGHVNDLEEKLVTAPEALNAYKKTLIGPNEGWEGWVMRLFTIKNGNGNTPRHSHGWPHINYIVSGTGILHLEGKDYPVSQGSIAYVPANARHQFTAAGEEDFSFICIVPEEGDF